MDSLNKTRNLFYIKVHEAKKALIKDNWSGKQSPFDSPASALKTSIYWVSRNFVAESYNYVKFCI